MSVSSPNISTLAFHFETTPGQDPVDDGNTWADQEGTTVRRYWHYAVEHATLRQAAIEDVRLSDRLGKNAEHTPINGLRNADGFSFQIPLCGAEAATTAASQVSETGTMQLLEHWLGGLSRGYSSAITTVNSDTSIDPTTTTGKDEGEPIFIEDDGDAGRLHPARILTWDGSTATLDRAPYTGLHADDDIEAAACAYIDQDALKDPADANASTVSALVVKDGNVWEAKGGVVWCESIDFARGDVPKMNWSGMFAYVEPYGDGAPAEPTWTGTVQGAQPLVVGADLKLHIQDKGTTELACFNVSSATLTTGVGRARIETVTECTQNMQGTEGYAYEVSPTILEVDAFISTDWQDDWDTKQAKIVNLYQVAAAGKAWSILGPDAILMEPPEYVATDTAQMMKLKFELREDRSLDATATNLDRARSKFSISQG